MKISRNELDKTHIEKLFSERKPVQVVFTKADGSRREMTATRDPRLIPAEKAPSGESEYRTENDKQIRVFDTDLQEWRSFNLDRLLSINGVEIE